MSSRPPNHPTTKASVVPALCVGLSLLLNVYLAGHLLSWKPAASAATGMISDSKSAEMQTAPAVVATAEPAAATESESPTFQWSEVESTDYRQYIANLRALGVPEQVIRDIISADINQVYTKRAREIWTPRVRAYWQKYSNERPSPKQSEQLTAVMKEQGTMLKDLLGVRLGRQEMIDTLYLQVQGSERQLCFAARSSRRRTASTSGCGLRVQGNEVSLAGQLLLQG